MSRKLILFLLLLTLAVVIYVVRIPQKPTTISSPIPLISLSPTPTLPAESFLSFIPDIIYTPAGQNGEASIQLNSQSIYPTGAQLELAYDPTIMTEVTLTPGTLFPKSAVLLNNNDETTGRISYAISLYKNEKPQNFSGTTAILKFKVKENIIQNQTAIYFLPKTAIIADGGNIPLKIAYGLKIIINPAPSASASPTLR